MNLFQIFFNRLKEPSTWAGLASIVPLLPIPGASGWQMIASGLAAVLAVSIPETKA